MLLIAAFNIGDLTGRYAAGVLDPFVSDAALRSLILARLVIIPALVSLQTDPAALGSLHDAAAMCAVMALAVSNGLCASLSLIKGQKIAMPGQQNETCSTILALAMCLGLVSLHACSRGGRGRAVLGRLLCFVSGAGSRSYGWVQVPGFRAEGWDWVWRSGSGVWGLDFGADCMLWNATLNQPPDPCKPGMYSMAYLLPPRMSSTDLQVLGAVTALPISRFTAAYPPASPQPTPADAS